MPRSKGGSQPQSSRSRAALEQARRPSASAPGDDEGPPQSDPVRVALQHLLARCLAELRTWLATHPTPPRSASDVFARVERTLRQLRRIRSGSEARELVHEMEQLIRDQGPLDADFLPSLEYLHALVAEWEGGSP